MVALVGSLIAATDIMAFLHPCHPIILIKQTIRDIFYVKNRTEISVTANQCIRGGRMTTGNGRLITR